MRPEKTCISSAAEHHVKGMGVAPGIGIGPAYVHLAGGLNVPRRTVAKTRVQVELERLHVASRQVRSDLAGLHDQVRGLPAAEAAGLGDLLDAYRGILEGSRLIRGVEARIREQRLNAEAAIHDEIAILAEAFAAMEDAYLAARIDDMRDLGRRLIRVLLGGRARSMARIPNRAVIIADDLTPADAALLDPNRIAGLVVTQGGADSHTAILARSLGLPAVIAPPEILDAVCSGASVVVDGGAGLVTLGACEATLHHYRKIRADMLRHRRSLQRLVKIPAVTRSDDLVTLQANVELPSELEAVHAVGADGIGLLRTEFMFLNRTAPPNLDEQVEALSALVRGMDGQPVTIRTLDLGADKLGSLDVGMPLSSGGNPAMGLRGIRLALRQPALLRTQLEAILRVAALGPVRVLLPMVSTAAEVHTAKGWYLEIAKDLKQKGVKLPDKLPPLGVMIEVPGAALVADGLAWHADFFSIGTNDLTQYALAIDRGDEAVAGGYNPFHPAVLRLIQFATEAASRARIPVAVCGEMAGDPEATALLLGLGIRDLSMASTSLLRVKQEVLKLDQVTAVGRARMIMAQTDPLQVAALMDSFRGA